MSESGKLIQLKFDADGAAILKRLRWAQGPDATTADVIRDALAFYEWTRQQLDAGYELALHKNGVPASVVEGPVFARMFPRGRR